MLIIAAPQAAQLATIHIANPTRYQVRMVASMVQAQHRRTTKEECQPQLRTCLADPSPLKRILHLKQQVASMGTIKIINTPRLIIVVHAVLVATLAKV